MKWKIFGFLGCFVFLSLVGEQCAKLTTKSKPVEQYAVVTTKKIYKLVELMTEGTVGLSLRDYRDLVFESPRNHTTFVLFYNDDTICESCKDVISAFEKIARSFYLHYTKLEHKSLTWNVQPPVFFVRVRMSEGYRNMLVDVEPSKPSVYYFAPARSSKYNQFEKMDQEFLVPGMSSWHYMDRILAFVEFMSDVRIPLEKETRSNGFLSSLFSASMIGVMILFNIYHFGYWNQFKDVLLSGNYSYLLAIIIIWLLSGQMFNYIRNAPMFGSNGFSVASLIYPGMRNQYGSESIVIMLLYATILYSIISLIEVRERQLSEHLTVRDVQGGILRALSGLYFAFMGLQLISQIKTGR